ncbi:glycoside hydrolase family 3 N-terminal domain-containing protein [Microbacterium sp. NE2HP2]|uniref:glycoside hydrolase family 3 N-terminal domain-containing protein n=1 Tax=Microbacterium TaxID=33882 RepID=UPI0023662F68|nr:MULTISPECIES: glycoside hydrolase family 3 N-terminal domain-containing protein [Microbacterium]MDD7944088.1 glycoside hydrolase family 3 N-terminal domain-containing protein [Microbacterium plantarum]WHE36416.1 glycoside hydrolase family 3 N-terminal domain-containing protein [Microbacterium sp. BDGP8]
MTRTPSSSRAARSAFAAALVGVLALAVGCAPEPAPADPTTSAPSPTATAPAPPTPTASPDPAAALGLEGCVGQMLMVGTPVDTVSPDAAAAIRDRGVGGLFLHGRSSSGVEATAALVAQFRDLAIDGSPKLWVATDQEGGEVQVLSGPGFDEIPYAIRQADLGPDALRTAATAWGGQLAAAGIDVNLAPVADIVTSAETRLNNPPIGALGRQYGYDEQAVAAGAGAFADGMRASGVLPTFKHFPGLGRVDANTDYTAEVLDSVVSADSPDVDVYRELTASGPSLVMVGTARYQHIDPDHPAAFSPAVLDLLRDRVGFDGVVITDDLSAAAAAEIVAPGDRAVEALSAGVDIVLASADPTVLPAMYDAVLARAQSDPAFAARVDESCGRVLEAKDAGTAG